MGSGFLWVHAYLTKPSLSGCVHTANLNDLLRSDHWSLNFSTQPSSSHGWVSRARECKVAVQNLCTNHPLFCLLQTECCSLILGSEDPFCPGWSSHWWGDFPECGNTSFFTASSLGCRTHPDFFLFVFLFVLPRYMEVSLPIQKCVWVLPVFTSYSVWIVPLVDTFLIFLWEKTCLKSYSSVILIVPPKLRYFNKKVKI